MMQSGVMLAVMATCSSAFVLPQAPLNRLPTAASSATRAASSLRMADEPLGVGVIGCGRIGDIHAKTLAFRTPGAKLVAVSDIFEEAGARVVEGCNGLPKFYKDWKEMVHDPEVGAIVVGSPTPFHAEQIIEAAKLGKHIFCEKPISFDVPTIDVALKAVADNDVKLLLGFQRRFDSNFRTIREKISEGIIGDVRTIHITSRDPAPPPVAYLQNSGGIFMDMTSHDFDMARFLVGDEIDEVFVTATAFDPEAKEADDFDTANTHLKFKNGAFGVIENSRRCSFGYDQRVEVFGAGGSISGANRSPQNVLVNSEDGLNAGVPYSFFLDRYADSYINIMSAFVKYVKTGDESLEPALGIDGKVTIFIGMAAARSAKEGRPVKISEIAAEFGC
ncbi:unnamed protein product [Ectocarpus sp. CCAP 1310/34]|nr:unnamed protein product [Ectocarpus sp. CCAP 1310/34]